MKTMRYLFAYVVLALMLYGCTPVWTITVIDPNGYENEVSHKTLDEFSEFVEEDCVPLERVLHTKGYTIIQDLQITDERGIVQTFDWATVAERAQLSKDGRLFINDTPMNAARIQGSTSAMLQNVTAHITDIAPTSALALGTAAPEQATGRTMAVGRASHVLLLFLDGFGYIRYEQAREANLIPNLDALGEPHVALTTYPPSTAVASASLLTGASPDVHGAVSRRIRKTDVQTLFDVVTDAGLSVGAVEGNALSFNLRNADITLSGDRDGNGSTDDNVLANALAVLDEGMPDLLWVHFHGIDDAGHAYGPDAPQERQAIRDVDAAVGEILAAVPEDTLAVIFADHGMHSVQEPGRLGNHGHLIARDMLIPIWVLPLR